MNEVSEVHERILLKRLINKELDALYACASSLGRSMGRVFAGDARSQLRNLESIASAATRTSTLKNHVKNQTGKDTKRKTWASEQDGSLLGVATLALLDDLAGRSTEIARVLPHGGTDEDGRELARSIEIELQRGVVQTAVCAALYGGALS